jgi:hypothetical protein
LRRNGVPIFWYPSRTTTAARVSSAACPAFAAFSPVAPASPPSRPHPSSNKLERAAQPSSAERTVVNEMYLIMRALSPPLQPTSARKDGIMM